MLSTSSTLICTHAYTSTAIKPHQTLHTRTRTLLTCVGLSRPDHSCVHALYMASGPARATLRSLPYTDSSS
jgi:hypothetical protein